MNTYRDNRDIIHRVSDNILQYFSYLTQYVTELATMFLKEPVVFKVTVPAQGYTITFILFLPQYIHNRAAVFKITLTLFP